MKAIVTATVLMMLTTAAWAEEPIVLSEAEMDGVTAGTSASSFRLGYVLTQDTFGSTSNSQDGIVGPQTWSSQVTNTGNSSTSIGAEHTLGMIHEHQNPVN